VRPVCHDGNPEGAPLPPLHQTWHDCSQPYVREELITGELDAFVRSVVTIPIEWTDWMLTELETESRNGDHADRAAADLVREAIGREDDKVKRLTEAYLERMLTLAEFRNAKAVIIAAKHELKEKLAILERGGTNRFEPATKFVKALKQAISVTAEGSPEEKRDLAKKIGSNLQIRDRHLSAVSRGAWKLVADQGSFAHHETPATLGVAGVDGETHHVLQQRRGRDSNSRDGLSRLQHFQCCSFGHSDTSPNLARPGRARTKRAGS
jgi:hypothetical protein